MISEYVRFANANSDIQLESLVGRVAADIYCTDLHVAICHQLASATAATGEIRLIIENLFCLKSVRARAVTALAWILVNQPGTVAALTVKSDVLAALRATHGTLPARVEDLGFFTGAYIDRRHVERTLFKAALHRLFRAFRKPLPVGRALVRAWVDVSLPMYEAELAEAQLRIHPFPMKVSRQLSFVRSCRREGRDCSLDGLPYSVLRALRLILQPERRDTEIADIELEAYARYADEIIRARTPVFLTSDEYEVGAVALYRRLIQNGTTTVNTAHGVGMYAPHVAYSEFRVTNVEQGEFYAHQNPAIRFVLRQTRNRHLPLSAERAAASDRFVLVLIHQNFESYAWWAEAAAQKRVATLLRGIADRFGAEYFMKLHPNTLEREAAQISAALGGRPLSRWNDLEGCRPVFVLINSTAYFEVREVGPTLVYAGPSFLPELYFGAGTRRFTEQTLEAEIAALADKVAWAAAMGALSQPPLDNGQPRRALT